MAENDIRLEDIAVAESTDGVVSLPALNSEGELVKVPLEGLGGGGSWELIGEVTAAEPVRAFEYSGLNYQEAFVFVVSNNIDQPASSNMYCWLRVNDKDLRGFNSYIPLVGEKCTYRIHFQMLPDGRLLCDFEQGSSTASHRQSLQIFLGGRTGSDGTAANISSSMIFSYGTAINKITFSGFFEDSLFDDGTYFLAYGRK